MTDSPSSRVRRSLPLLGALGLTALSAFPTVALAQEPGAYMYSPPPYDAPSAPPPPIDEVELRPSSPGAVDGQWVYTTQYGWVWMPYDRLYTHVVDDREPTMYVYGARFGWRWVTAPWVLSGGPEPYWGDRGRARFEWHARPWFARRDYRPAVVVREPRIAVVRDRRPVVIRENRTVVYHDHRPAYVQEIRAPERRDYRERAEAWRSHRDERASRGDYHRDARPDMRREFSRERRQSYERSRREEARSFSRGDRREQFARGGSREGHGHGHGHGHGRR